MDEPIFTNRISENQIYTDFTYVKYFIFLLVVLAIWLPIDGFAACRTYHYDHDGNPHTAFHMRIACTRSYSIRKIPKYVTHQLPAIQPQTVVKKLRHLSLPKQKRRCAIPNIYQFTQMQTISHCAIR